MGLNIRLKQSSYDQLPFLDDFKDREHELQVRQFYRLKDDKNRIGQWMRNKKNGKHELWLFKVDVFPDETKRAMK